MDRTIINLSWLIKLFVQNININPQTIIQSLKMGLRLIHVAQLTTKFCRVYSYYLFLIEKPKYFLIFWIYLPYYLTVYS